MEIVGVYVERNGMKGKLQALDDWMRGSEEGMMTIVGGF